MCKKEEVSRSGKKAFSMLNAILQGLGVSKSCFGLRLNRKGFKPWVHACVSTRVERWSVWQKLKFSENACNRWWENKRSLTKQDRKRLIFGVRFRVVITLSAPEPKPSPIRGEYWWALT